MAGDVVTVIFFHWIIAEIRSSFKNSFASHQLLQQYVLLDHSEFHWI